MTFLNIAKSRYSVRNYSTQKVEQEKIDKIIESAHVAPTAANLQPVRLIVVTETNGLNSISKATNIYNAPMAIIVCSDTSKSWKRPFDGKNTSDIDASIITDHMMLQATELGLGSVWICYFKPDIIRKEFRLPETLEPVNILAVGYSAETPADSERHTSMRKPLKELVSYETL